ncbi:MAG: hypothetical protein Kow0027_21800 [Saprospiraceae bacterium]|jgi:uncharacterized cupredoxin-like copper-binding protein|nr:hypothetical protein [Saprospirales bacterium]RME04151.1 MAG: DUF1573 domain-containing protein [Bacteroidota bacterium]
MKFRTHLITFALPLLAIALFSACANDAENDSLDTIKTEGKISQIIRNPVSADGTVDTVNVAKMTFEEPEFNFGEVKEGDVVSHVFKFTNTGKVPLLINNAKSTCGCTIPKWPKEFIEPGQSGEIAVEFNTSGKSGFQEKPVTITANTYPSTTRIYLRGFVNEAKQ